MSNYCAHCRYDPKRSVGEHACPFTTLYWDFLARHERRLRSNQRMAMQLKNLSRLAPELREEITAQAAEIRSRL
jgi:deoxyribodipyrimidine photolyase-related protein